MPLNYEIIHILIIVKSDITPGIIKNLLFFGKVIISLVINKKAVRRYKYPESLLKAKLS